MKFMEFDTVVLLKDYKERELKKGDMGAVIMAYAEPEEAYEVEFVDDDGNVKAQIVLAPNEIAKYSK